MKTVNKILVPTDFSESSQHALAEAVAIAKRNDAEIILLYVMEDVYLPVQHVMQHHSFPNVADEMRKGCKRQLSEEAETVGTDVKIRTKLREGTPSLEIAAEAEEEKVDVIVVGSHGEKGFRRFLLGSTTERVVQIAPCAVVVSRLPQTES